MMIGCVSGTQASDTCTAAVVYAPPAFDTKFWMILGFLAVLYFVAGLFVLKVVWSKFRRVRNYQDSGSQTELTYESVPAVSAATQLPDAVIVLGMVNGIT